MTNNIRIKIRFILVFVFRAPSFELSTGQYFTKPSIRRLVNNNLELSGNRNEELYMVQDVYLELLPRSRYTYIRGASDVYSGSSAARCASAAVSQPHQQTPVGIIFPFPTSVLLLLIVPYVLSFAGSLIFHLTSLGFDSTIIY